MATTNPPPRPAQPAPPAGWSPTPAGAAKPKRGSRGALYGVIATVGGIAILAALGFFLIVQPKNDAKAVLRDAQPVVQRSLQVSARARQDVTKFMRGGSVAVRRRAIGEINQAISLRQRAMKRLADMNGISFPGDSNYKRSAKLWISTMRGSLKSLRGFRAAVPARVSTSFLERRSQATAVVTEMLYLMRWDQLIRKTDRTVVSDLI